MTETVLFRGPFFRDFKLFQVLTGEEGNVREGRTVDLGEGLFLTTLWTRGLLNVERVTVTTFGTGDDARFVSARAFGPEGERLATFAGFDVAVADLRTGGLAALFRGDDYILGNGFRNLLRGYDGNDTLRGGTNDDTLIGNAGQDALNGGGGGDRLQGGLGRDVLVGAGGDDRLQAFTGQDRLNGGTGDDRLTGGGERDVFLFRTGDGTDTITDFQDRIDRIEIASGPTDFAGVTVTDAGADTIVSFGDVTIRLVGVDAGLIRAGDFLFG